ncbi:MAG TPA: hypothetical protein VHP11_08710 [Tepidisphaeraceae bacterium]|nr:hypothetical protein [Tepidisphaeraceae bacterium]
MRLTRYALLWCAMLVGLATASGAYGETDLNQYLGARFTSRAAGLSFKPPVNGTQIKPATVGTNIVQYVNSDEKWALKVSQMVFEEPTRLVGVDDPSTPTQDEAQTRPGVLAQIAQQVTVQQTGIQIMRQDVINVGACDGGILVFRYMQGTQAYLRQMAVLERNDQHYYVLDLTTPSNRASDEKENVEDPSEALAVQIFRGILDSVQLLDLKAIRADNDERLYRSRTLLVNLPTRLKEIIAPESFFRVQRKGKDIGWSFVVEEFGERQGQSGLYVATLSQGSGEPGSKVDVASEMFCADGRKSETWVTITEVEKNGVKEPISEYGQSDRRIVRVVEGASKDAKNPQEPAIREIERYKLNVTQTNKTGPMNISRELAPYYLPQPLSSLLPRLVPLDEAKGYLFLVWVSGERELVHRYIDVEGERSVMFAGKTIQAVVVRDRLGLEGEPTYHYFSRDGKYLGFETPSAGLAVIASNQKTLGELWPNANFVRPRVLDGKK